MDAWQTKKILILGMTYPSYSKKYRENACTGGIEEDTHRMVRIHPLPIRYLESEHRFKTFQWITAKVAKHPSDPRPESLRVEPDSIVLGEKIPPSDPEARRKYVERSPHVAQSVEALFARDEKDRPSLATIRPKEIVGVRLQTRSKDEEKEWLAKEEELFSQEQFAFERPPKRLDFPEMKFLISWRCDDSRCVKPHEMSLQQWGIHELWRKYRHEADGKEKVRAAILDQLDMKKRDVFLFLGSFRGKMFNYGLMDTFSPGRNTQMTLL